MTTRLASFNVENLFARAKALDTATWGYGGPALAAFEEFNQIAAKKVYSDTDKSAMLTALTTLRVLVETGDGLRVNKKQFDNA